MKNLTNVYTVDEICQRISAGTFKDLYVGDYFDISITTDLGGAETVRCILAGFDVFWNNGDTAFTKHHAVIVPKDCFKTKSVMNNIQFPLFRLAPNLKVAGLGHNGSRWWYWLSAVVSAAAFANCNNNGNSNNNNAAGDGGVRPISCMYTKCRLCADIRYRKGKLVLPKGKEAHLLIEGGWGNILMHPDTSVGARNEVKLYE